MMSASFVSFRVRGGDQLKQLEIESERVAQFGPSATHERFVLALNLFSCAPWRHLTFASRVCRRGNNDNSFARARPKLEHTAHDKLAMFVCVHWTREIIAIAIRLRSFVRSLVHSTNV